MFRKNISKYIAIGYFSLLLAACKMPVLVTKTENKTTPASYTGTANNANTSQKKWHDYFTDPFLVALIDTALKNNQELNITLQEIEIARNEARAKKGEYLPFVGVKGSAGLDKSSRYTQQGANDPNAEIAPGREIPEPLANYGIGAYAQWEVDIWHKLRNVRKAALYRYVATQEGKNFVVTQLIAEIANSYYELLALDNQLAIIDQNIEIQTNALAIVRLQKEAGRTTELAVRKFEAEVLNTQSLQYGIKQKITETENRINFLLGRFPQPIKRNDQSLISLTPTKVSEGIPAQLLEQRPDVRQAEQLLSAAKLDIKVARAQFYPSLGLSATIGAQAFNPSYLAKLPESVLASLAGEMAGLVVNRNGLKANYLSANAKQTQAVYNYERTLLNAYLEVANQLAKITNLELSYDLKDKQVQALTSSIAISGDLFKSARADYMEVLLTQRDALDARFDLIEIKKQQMSATVNIYQALGGGWN